ncbi:MAG: hypothetical protein PWQ76_105 [Clostridiales bacterium]|nr:hypothetical protein [Clostridiales bacterium]
MKKFEFTLGKLLGYKEQVLKKEKNDLAALRKQQQQAMEERQRLIEKLEHSNREFAEKCKKGMSPQHIVLEKSYINSVCEQIRALERSIELFGVKIEKQLVVVVEASKEVSTLEKLRDKQFEDYQKAVQKSEELFISEFVANKSFHKV